MTCIAGIVHNGKVYMGCDSAGTNGGELDLRRRPKIHRFPNFIVGAAGSGLIHQVLDTVKLPVLTVGTDIYPWICSSLLSALKRATANWHEEETFEALIGVQGQLFHLWGASQVVESAANFDACGSGAQIARGALFVAERHWQEPKMCLELALEAAERFSTGVRGPFTFEMLE